MNCIQNCIRGSNTGNCKHVPILVLPFLIVRYTLSYISLISHHVFYFRVGSSFSCPSLCRSITGPSSWQKDSQSRGMSSRTDSFSTHSKFNPGKAAHTGTKISLNPKLECTCVIRGFHVRVHPERTFVSLPRSNLSRNRYHF